MKTLALLSIWLALPLCADAPSPAPLTSEENEKIMLFYIQLQSTQIAYYRARDAYETGMKELAATHAASGCEWNFNQKAWSCK